MFDLNPQEITITMTSGKAGVTVLKCESFMSKQTLIINYEKGFEHIAGMWQEGQVFDYLLTAKGELERERENANREYNRLKEENVDLLMQIEGLKKPKRKKGWGTQPPIKAACKATPKAKEPELTILRSTIRNNVTGEIFTKGN